MEIIDKDINIMTKGKNNIRKNNLEKDFNENLKVCI